VEGEQRCVNKHMQGTCVKEGESITAHEGAPSLSVYHALIRMDKIWNAKFTKSHLNTRSCMDGFSVAIVAQQQRTSSAFSQKNMHLAFESKLFFVPPEPLYTNSSHFFEVGLKLHRGILLVPDPLEKAFAVHSCKPQFAHSQCLGAEDELHNM
jgi:hypothetical protein